jgi:hypothetical protein
VALVNFEEQILADLTESNDWSGNAKALEHKEVRPKMPFTQA